MTVVFLDPVGTLGGAERSLLDLAFSLRQAAPTLPLAVVVGGDGPLVGEAERLGALVRVVPLPSRLARTGEQGFSGSGEGLQRLARMAKSAPALLAASAELVEYAVRLRRAVVDLAPSVVHSNGVKMHLLSAMIPLPGVPVFWHVRDFLGARPLMAHVLHAIAWRPAGLLAISQAVKDDVFAALGRSDATVVYNGIDTARFTPEGPRADLDALAGMAPAGRETLRVGLVATYARWKGQGLFLEAAAQALKSLGRERVRFYVVGGRAYATEESQYSETELRSEMAQRALGDAAGLVPFQSDPAMAYRALDVVVHASTRPEPFGRTIVEGMACARPVVVAREGGAAELVTEDIDAVSVAPRDPRALAEAIVALARDPARRTRLGARARATAASRFGRERLGPEVLEAYRRTGVRHLAR
jgi:glycosyltransferase involved in cell wall biosynthesis